MMYSITRSLNSYNFDKTNIKKQIFANKNYLFGLHMLDAIVQVNTVKEIPKLDIKSMLTIW